MADPAGGAGTLAGKVALITGAASGIGLAMARLFADEGASLSLLDLDAAAGRAAAREITARRRRAIFIHGDVALDSDCRRALEETEAAFGGLDILCNNAGAIRRATVVETDPEEWDRLLAVNLTGVFLMSRHAIPRMAARGGGVILNTASGWGLAGGPRAAAYCAAKGGVVQLTRAMAIDHGPQGIRVNCLCPGDVETPMLQREAAELGEGDAEFLEIAARRPLGRVGEPEEVARAALFLTSEAASYVTGAALVVDGGGLAG